MYDPTTGFWSTTGSLNTGRFWHATTLLSDGRVLIAGGVYYAYDYRVLDSAEVYDRGLGFDPAWRPTLSTVTSPLVLGTRLQISGSGFRGFSEASGGNSQNSATNYPLVQLRRVDNEQVRWLLPDPNSPFSDTAFTSLPVIDFPPGHALVTAFVNGIPSESKLILVRPPGLSILKSVAPSDVVPGQPLTYTLAFANTDDVTATNVLITDVVPSPTFAVRGVISSGVVITDISAGAAYAWRVQDLAPAEGGVITLTGVVSPALTADTLLTNTATITAAGDGDMTNNSSTAVVTVTVPRLAFSSVAYNVVENAGPALITVTLNVAPALTVTVDHEASGGTATAGEDYVSASGTLTFTPGVIMQTFAITVTDDLLDEPPETVALTLSNAHNGVITGTNPATLTIVDDDDPPALSINDASVTEGDSGAVDAIFSVTLSITSAKPITVEYATVDGSATAPTDYTALPTSTLTFLPGATTQLITVTVQGDTLDEPDETFWVNLANPVNATLGDDQGQGTIFDDDVPVVGFSAAAYSVGEADEVATITATLDVTSWQTVTVDYATADGSATVNDDYIAVSGTLTFTPGLTLQTFTVPMLDDVLDEPDETITLTLKHPLNSTLGLFESATLIILDDDLALYLPLVMRNYP